VRRTERAGIAASLALLLLMAWAAPAAAAAPSHQAWAATGPAAPPNPTAGNLYVSTVGGQEQARAFVEVDLAGRGVEDVAAASLTLTPGSDGVVADQATLAACTLAEPLTADGKLDKAPAVDCSVRAPLTRQADGTWTLSLAPFADRWSAGGPAGVAIIPDTDAGPAVFTVSLAAERTSFDGPVAVTPADDTSTSGTDATPVAPPIPSTESLFTVDPAPVPAPVPPVASAPSHAPAPSTITTVVARRGGVDRPPWIVVLVPAAVIALLLVGASRRRPGGVVTTGSSVPARLVPWLAVPLIVALLGETTTYKLGSVAIVFIAAVGLHLLVNWTGELSLAHAGFIGVPAFVVAQFSAHTGLTPLLGLPLAIVTGVALGGVVGVAALRARGLQVALVTLAVGIAIGQFLFFRSWIVGPPQGLLIPTPSILGHPLASSRALAPVLVATIAVVVLLTRAIMRSTIGRAMLMVREDPDAAAAAGVAVAQYRALAYALAGGFAGVAGWSYVVWVQQVTPKAFPLQLGFTYLVIAALAGPGGLAGVAVAALVIQGGALFSILPGRTALYLGPVALIYNVTRYQAGINGLLAGAASFLRGRKGAPMTKHHVLTIRPLAVAAVSAIVTGTGAILLAWYHMGNTDQVWIQNQELASGGLLGLSLIMVGAALLIRDGIVRAAELREHQQPEPPVVEASTNGHKPRMRVKETV